MIRASTMWADAPTRAQTRQVAKNVFERGEFQRKLSLIARFFRWLSHLFHFNSPNATAPSTGPGTGLFVYLILIGLLVVLVWIIVRVARTWTRAPKKVEEVDEVPEVEVPKTRKEWRSDAETAEAEGRWKDAILARYRELVLELVERRVVDRQPGRTTGELRGDVASSAPAASDAFDEATLLFELPWYADVDTGPAQNQRFKELAASVLSAAPAVERSKPDRSDHVEVPA